MEPKRTKLGHQLGLLCCLGGFVLVWVGWNGAASYDDSSRQFPYLISGGIAGLCLVNVGIGLWIVQSQRAERSRLEENLLGLNRVLETLVEVTGLAVGAASAAGHADGVHAGGSGNGLVLAGTTAYHRPACQLVQDHPRLRTMTADMAADSGLAPCRTCAPEPGVVQLPS
ncbi:MAG TPA: hypothetical protein VEG38_16725 [Acidimicrobiia bacterium]|nr:hypothetical protein [Acidimicrobiia bacterium]